MANTIVSNTSQRYGDFLVDGVKAISLTFVSDISEMSLVTKYQPEFVYRHFGDNETIFGYKDLSVTLYHTDASMYFYPKISYTEEISSVDNQFKPDNILEKLSTQLPVEQVNVLCQTGAIFKSRLDDQKNFEPFGVLLSKLTFGGAEFQMWMVNKSTEAFDAYLARVQTLAFWYIEGVEHTDNSDPCWQHYFLYESKQGFDGRLHLSLAGYASTVRFYHYPDKIRCRIAQILILPQYSGRGVGARFLKEIYSDLVHDPAVIDITAEAPAESFIRTRDFVNCCNCSTLREFQASNLKNGFSEEMKCAALTRFKINPKQARRVYEILRLLHTNIWDVKAMEQYESYVKRRLEKPFKRSIRDWKKLLTVLDNCDYSAVVASHLNEEQEAAKLEQLYQDELANYKIVINRLVNFNQV
ncbi:unnamed protein product [Thelazia callipaeda]|uniref:Histone acetyltransferase type B catalytic subunit n=1 Tax=Thelazia callipaeda TaxID=103827 RepID=A0A0N5CP55_THECL|nr:unnamed protein product [Thelazia callipaeda]